MKAGEPHGEDGTAKLTDFGISRASGDGTLTAAGLLAGTPAYLAPEVAQGYPAVQSSDLFSLGATLYCAIEGTPPFGVDANPIALLHRIANNQPLPAPHAGPLTGILASLLRTDPDQRPSARETERALTSIAVGPIPPLSEDQRPSEKPSGPVGLRRPRVIVGVLVLAVLLTTGVLVAIALNSGSQSVATAPPLPRPTTSSPLPSPSSTPSSTPSPPSTTTEQNRVVPPSSASMPSATPSQDGVGQLTDAIVGYYQLMPGNLSSAWNHMTADYQQHHAGGMSGYERFWQPIARVSLSDVTPSPPDSVTATVTYDYRDGNVVVERTRYGLVRQDGMWKIASSTVLSHSGNT